MRRIAGLLATAALSLALAACASANAVAPSGPSAVPASSAGAAGPDSAAVHIDAKDIAFTESSVSAPANRSFQLVFSSQDGAPHNVTIVGPDGNPVFTGDVITGPTSTTYNVPALAPGSYTFRCDIHPNMTGTLVVR